eukprot:87082_1
MRSAHCLSMSQKRQNNINNLVTGKYLSVSTAEIASSFWQKNVQNLALSDKLEIGSSIFFSVIISNKQMKNLFKKQLKNNSVASLGIHFMDMMGWLMRNLLANEIDLYSTLKQLGVKHKYLGISKMKYFDQMLFGLNKAFEYYLQNKYTIKDKDAINKVFIVISNIMMGNQNFALNINKFINSFNNFNILNSMNNCLSSPIGKEYFCQYLNTTYCEEIVVWLQSLDSFYSTVNESERFIIAENIYNRSISRSAPFGIAISHETRQKMKMKMKKLNNLTKIPSDLFVECETEIYKLIEANHWKRFQRTMIVSQKRSMVIVCGYTRVLEQKYKFSVSKDVEHIIVVFHCSWST